MWRYRRNNLPSTTGAYKSSKQGTAEDGFVARFNAALGSLTRSTYVGTSDYDQTFLLDVDKLGNVFVFGQTFGNYPITAGSWGTPQYRKQFIHKISADLGTSMASTAFGSPQGTINLVPTAFNVDDCLNILLSGWGGVTNSGFVPTSVDQLPTSSDALQTATNGSDFYFMVLGKNFTSFEYGSYFGGLLVLSTSMAEPLALTIEDAFTKLYVPGAEVTMTFQLHRVLSPKPITVVIVTSG